MGVWPDVAKWVGKASIQTPAIHLLCSRLAELDLGTLPLFQENLGSLLDVLDDRDWPDNLLSASATGVHAGEQERINY